MTLHYTFERPHMPNAIDFCIWFHRGNTTRWCCIPPSTLGCCRHGADVGENVGPHDLYDALNITVWHDNGFSGDNVKIAVFDVEWMGAEWQNENWDQCKHDCLHIPLALPIDSTHPRFGFERGVHGWPVQR